MDQLVQVVARSLFEGDAYTAGIFTGLVIALAVGLTGAQLAYWWGRILQFFAPSKPSFTGGPSGSAKLGTCVEAAISLVLFLALVFVLVWGATTR